MKYELETIPVWDAFKDNEECPLCILETKYEQTSLNFFLGDSVMDPQTRIKVNQDGFCDRHFGMMFHSDHKLGVALMAHTHLAELIQGLRKIGEKAGQLLNKNKGALAAEMISDYIKSRTSTCVFCERIRQTMDRYTFTTIYLWKKEDTFRAQFDASKGFCMNHLPRIFTMAAEVLSGKQLTDFLQIVTKQTIERLDTVGGELLWYTQKFDYRNKELPWNNSKDALIRTLQKLKGHQFYQKKEEPDG